MKFGDITPSPDHDVGLGPISGGPGDRLLVLACGALVKELQAIVAANGLDGVTIECLPAELHNRPQLIADRLRMRLEQARTGYDRILVGYADCGTAGAVDQVCAEFGVDRLPGAHCYEFFATSPVFESLQDADPATFYLTDFLARHFDLLVIRGLGIDRHPQLLDSYFGNYHRLVYLAQLDDPSLVDAAKRAADRLGLNFELHRVGYGRLSPAVVQFATGGKGATSG